MSPRPTYPWHVYMTQLLTLGMGHALWEPDPPHGPPVEVGDVGFVRYGQFQRLFNIHLDAGHQEQEPVLPAHFEPLPLNRTNEVMPRILRRGAYCSKSVRAVNVGAQVNLTQAIPIGANTSFKCSRQKGAILALSADAYGEDILPEAAYKDYMRDNLKHWCDLADRRGLDISEEEIMLVKGRHLTSAWAVAAFTDSEVEAEVEVALGVSGMPSVGLSTAITSRDSQSIQYNWGPREQFQPSDTDVGHQLPSSSTTPTQSNSRHGVNTQCIAVRVFQMKRRWIAPDRIIAAASPKDLEQSHDDSEETPILSVQNQTVDTDIDLGDTRGIDDHELEGVQEMTSDIALSHDRQSTEFMVHTEPDVSDSNDFVAQALDYILQNTDADYAIVDTSDISLYLKNLGDGMTFTEHLRILGPEITMDPGPQDGPEFHSVASFLKPQTAQERGLSSTSTESSYFISEGSSSSLQDPENAMAGTTYTQQHQGTRWYLRELNKYLMTLPNKPTANWRFTQEGPDHEPTFTAYLTLDNHDLAMGTGSTKVDAKDAAAKVYLELAADEW